MTEIRVGLLAFYLELYDRVSPKRRQRINQFYDQIAAALERRGLHILRAPVCRLEGEFRAAVRGFEKEGAEALITLHLAYSPSLESAGVLAKTALPIIVLDTTPTFDYGPHQDPDELMFNHGIHGVQDMCNLLIRHGKPFQIEAGHWQESDVLARVTAAACAARMASAMRRARVGRIGPPFRGMGDFAVPSTVLKKTMGVETVLCPAGTLRRLSRALRPAEEMAEAAACRLIFDARQISSASLRRSVRASLAVRHWMEQEHLTAFTMNFLSITRTLGLPTVPFLEACLAMARGNGYAGESDVLTAALVSALLAAYPETTFSEMFCPDWKGNRIFISHMSEVNHRLLAKRPCLLEKPFPYTNVPAPLSVAGCLRGGQAVWVNLAPLPQQRFRLIVAPVTMQTIRGPDRMASSVRGWMEPSGSVADFLAAYSRLGGTHHAALVYGDAARSILSFGELMGWETALIER